MAQHPHIDRAKMQQAGPEHIGTENGLSTGETWAIAGSVVWMFVSAFAFWMAWPDPAPANGFALSWFMLVALAVILPAALVWLGVAVSGGLRQLRRELALMQSNLDRLAKTVTQQPALSPAPAPALPEAPPAPAPALPEAPPASQTFASKRAVSGVIAPRSAAQSPADQPSLALDAPDDGTAPIARPDLIKALHFPDDEHDTAGFAALRRALRDRGARKLVQASQDVLTLMSQDGIYMDDMTPAPASAAVWRSFAKGERGKPVAHLGGITDEACLSKLALRAREDAIFRDVVHHFLRQFDQFLETFEAGATDTDFLALADTRTARAFMLLARNAGTFD